MKYIITCGRMSTTSDSISDAFKLAQAFSNPQYTTFVFEVAKTLDGGVTVREVATIKDVSHR